MTLGKKIFSIGIMRTDSVKISPLFLFMRTFIGKYALETMVPIFIGLKIFFNGYSIPDLLILILLFMGQCICLIVTKKYQAIHDLIAATVAVDFLSQKIYSSLSEKENDANSVH